MNRKMQSLSLLVLTVTTLQFSCTTALGTALRDAAIGAAAAFVEQITGEILSNTFDPTPTQE